MADLQVASYDVLLQLLDRDPWGTLQGLSDSRSLEGLAAALSYGTTLPQGRQWGSRTQRSDWLKSERAKAVRRQAVAHAVELLASAQQSQSDLADFVTTARYYRNSRGSGPLLRALVRLTRERRSKL